MWTKLWWLLIGFGLCVTLLGNNKVLADEDDLVVEDDNPEDLDTADLDDLDDDGDTADLWDNTGDVQDMGDDTMPSKVYAVLHVNGEAISETIKKFMHTESANYPTLSVADVNADPPRLKFFASENDKLHDTVATAIEVGKMSEEEVDKVIPGESLRTDVEVLAQEELTDDMDLEDITGLLADRNVHRSDPDEDDTLDVLEDEDYESDDDSARDDGDGTTKPKRKKRNWRERRAKRLENEEKKRQQQKDDFKPSYSLGTGVGLQIPGWGLFILFIGGCAGIAFLVIMLQRILQESKERDEQRNKKREKREKRKLQKEKSRRGKQKKS